MADVNKCFSFTSFIHPVRNRLVKVNCVGCAKSSRNVESMCLNILTRDSNHHDTCRVVRLSERCAMLCNSFLVQFALIATLTSLIVESFLWRQTTRFCFNSQEPQRLNVSESVACLLRNRFFALYDVRSSHASSEPMCLLQLLQLQHDCKQVRFLVSKTLCYVRRLLFVA